MTISVDDLADEMTLKQKQYPFILLIIGSAMATQLIHEDGRGEICEFNPSAGKTCLSVGMALTGAKSFDELIALAARGDSSKVDLTTGDLKKKGHSDVDWYSLMPQDALVFCMGKLSESRYDGTYTKADIAAGVIKSYCRHWTQTCLLGARMRGVSSVVCVGSFPTSTVTREAFEECFLGQALLETLSGKDQIRMGVLSHASHLVALGVWNENMKMEQQRTKQSS